MGKGKKTVLFIGPEFGFSAALRCADGKIHLSHCETSIDAVTRNLKHSDGLIDASMQIPLTPLMLNGAKTLQVISTATTGSDHINKDAIDKKGIKLYTLKEDREFLWNITSAAEHSWALLMILAGQLVLARDHVIGGKWCREEFPRLMLRGKTIGLIGCGRIGQWMARYSKGFDMNVRGYDPYLSSWPSDIESVSLDSIFESSDFISIHVHLKDDTFQLVDRNLINKMKPGAILINTSRGGVLDEKALLDALISGRVGGAGLDVLQGEPQVKNHALVEYARTNTNLLITPHCAGYSPEAVAMVCERATEKIIQYFYGA